MPPARWNRRASLQRPAKKTHRGVCTPWNHWDGWGGVGGTAAGIPNLLQGVFDVEEIRAYQVLFFATPL